MTEETINEERPKTLKDYSLLIDGKACTCGATFRPEDLRNYEHPGGYVVLGWTMLQWLYAHCHRCGYDMALWKLGVPIPREDGVVVGRDRRFRVQMGRRRDNEDG